MTEDRTTAYRALLSQALFDGDFFAVRGRQGDKAIANRFYNLLPLIAELREADRGAKGTAMNDKALVSEEMVRQAIFYCPHELSTPAKHRWMANELNREVQAALGVGGWRPIAEAPKDGTGFLALTQTGLVRVDYYNKAIQGEWHSRSLFWEERPKDRYVQFMHIPFPEQQHGRKS